MDGVFVLNKPSGPTSNRCLSFFKRLGQKKIGHAGTLDPMASGVLIVLLGQATKISSYLLEGGGKIYSGVIRLGLVTDTWDIEGRVMDRQPWQTVAVEDLDQCVVRDCIASWVQLSSQEVPAYSAAKHNGQPFYRLARKGAETPDRVRAIKITQAETLDIRLPLVRFRVACSSGTYVRSLAHSLGRRLGCGATLCELVREYSYPFDIASSSTLEELAADPALLGRNLRHLVEALPDWPRLMLTETQAMRVRNGMPIACDQTPGQVDANADRVVLMFRQEAIALAQRRISSGGQNWGVMRGLWN